MCYSVTPVWVPVYKFVSSPVCAAVAVYKFASTLLCYVVCNNDRTQGFTLLYGL
jgi:hypothetical protein